jgi:hypothetical protein
MNAHHSLMGGKLHLYKRPNSNSWQCSTYLAGKNWRMSTKEDSLARAKDFAEDWYLGLKGKHRAGDLKVGKTFKFAAEKFKDEYAVVTQGERSPRYVKLLAEKLDVHLIPFFGDRVLSEITPGLVQEYRVHRVKTAPRGNRRTAYSLRHTYICLRLMEGADIYQVAKNCRTSVEMIERFYARHIKNTLDAASINVRRPRPGKKGQRKTLAATPSEV